MEKEGIEYDRDALIAQAEDQISSQKVLDFLKSTCTIIMQPYDPEVEKTYGMQN